VRMREKLGLQVRSARTCLVHRRPPSGPSLPSASNRCEGAAMSLCQRSHLLQTADAARPGVHLPPPPYKPGLGY
jgi:hypothetical protein